jgi:hypothetical protein
MDEVEFDMPEPSRLMLAGDWHGGRHQAERAIEAAAKDGVDAIIHLGDFGYWPAWEEHTSSQTGPCAFSARVRGWAEEAGIPLYWLDGNHENHDALHPGQGNQWLRHLPRGHRWQWWGKTWMAIGGGVSVDKKFRTQGDDWFPEETLTPEQWEHCMREGDVSIVVSHDCPSGVLIPGVHALQKQGKTPEGDILPAPWFPIEQLHESEAHRGLLGDIADEKDPAYWFHGHYHTRYNGTRKNPKWVQGGPVTSVHGLDEGGAGLQPNVVIITEKDLP